LADKKELTLMNDLLSQENKEFQSIIDEGNAKFHREKSLNKELSRRLQKSEEKISEKQSHI
jgi:hypothetical protein